MAYGVRCEQGKICNNGNCVDGTIDASSKHSHLLSHSRTLLGVGDTTYKWVHECVGSRNTSRCKGSDNTYDETGEECGCEVNNSIRYQWGDASDRCGCDGHPVDNVPCLDTENNDAEVPDYHCGCQQPSQEDPCEEPKNCFYWEYDGMTSCSATCGGTMDRKYVCINYPQSQIVMDSKCPQPKPAETYQCTGTCSYYWDYQPWSQCSQQCGGGGK
jgi:hypothetical protein